VNICYDSLEKDYTCEEIKINCIFAGDVIRMYKEKRYGIKSCKKDLDEKHLWDLQQLLAYSLQMDLDSFDKNTYRNRIYLEELAREQNANGCLADFKIQNLEICNISDLIEKINSL
jgi:hypothetical protein